MTTTNKTKLKATKKEIERLVTALRPQYQAFKSDPSNDRSLTDHTELDKFGYFLDLANLEKQDDQLIEQLCEEHGFHFVASTLFLLVTKAQRI